MILVNIGNIAAAYSNGRLPQCGMIIEATREELCAIEGDMLYGQVTVKPIGSVAARRPESPLDPFLKQIERCREITERLNANGGRRKYTREEVFAIIDELLDGVKPEEGEVAQ